MLAMPRPRTANKTLFHFVLRLVTLEVFTISALNLAHINAILFLTLPRNFFLKTTLENKVAPSIESQ